MVAVQNRISHRNGALNFVVKINDLILINQAYESQIYKVYFRTYTNPVSQSGTYYDSSRNDTARRVLSFLIPGRETRNPT